MVKRRQLLLLAAAAGASVSAWWWPQPLPRAPHLTLTTVTGSRVRIGGQQTQPQLIQFWATTCAPCLRELPALIRFYHRLHPAGLKLIAIAMAYDQPNRVKAFARQMPLPYPVVLDANKTAARAFGDVQFTPTTFLINRDGRIVQRYLGHLDFPALRQTVRELL